MKCWRRREPKFFQTMITPLLRLIPGILTGVFCIDVACARILIVANEQPGAADGNPGTLEKPFLTINAAAQLAGPGDSVLVHRGTYRERVAPLKGGLPGQPVIYQVAAGETVSVKGSDVWTHWQAVSGHPGVFAAEIAGHVPDGQPNPFLIGISIAASDQDIVARPSTSADNMPKTLGQIFFDGRPVVEASSEESVFVQENSWVVSADGTRLLAHFPGSPSDLSSHLIEVTIRNRIFAPHLRGLNQIQVKGFIFEHCANQGPFPQGGAVSPRTGADWLIEGNTIRFAKTVGLDVGNETFDAKGLKETSDDQKVRMKGGHHVIQNNVISDNGLVGIVGHAHNGVVIRNNVVERNNSLGFNQFDTKWEEWGGIKLHGPDALIEGNLVRDNEACGIWIDNNYTNGRITRNVVLNNRMAGIFLELGDGRCLVDNNVVALTRPRDDMYGGMGIYAHDSSGLVIAHNLIYGNADCGVLLRTVSDRVFPPPWEPNSRPVRTADNRILNNIIWNNSKPAISLPYPSDRAWNNVSDYNIVYASRDLWLGFEPDPTLFAVNLYKSNLKMDQLEAKLKEVLAAGKVPGEDFPNFKNWRRNPTLNIGQWRLLMGQDTHSKEGPKLVEIVLRAQVPMIGYQADKPVLHMQCPEIEGVDRDFFGHKFKVPNIRPGPFQDISEIPAEQSLFPIRSINPKS